MFPSIDFETYSEAGYTFTPDGKRQGRGIAEVGAAAYAAHPSTEVLCCKYQETYGGPIYYWLPEDLPPVRLLRYVAAGGILSAANSSFEYYIWNYVCTQRYGWRPIALEQFRDTLASARAWGLPGALDNVAAALGLGAKDPRGKRLIQLYSVPQSATKKHPEHRRTLDTSDRAAMLEYCHKDVELEADLQACMPHLSVHEEQVWLLDQRVNTRGVTLDVEAIRACKTFVSKVFESYERELSGLTLGAVKTVGQVGAMTEWVNAQLSRCGIPFITMSKADVAMTLERTDIPYRVRRVLEVRQLLGSSSIKKLDAMLAMLCPDGRVRGLLQYCGAERTGRWAGRGIQVQNLPRSGPSLNGQEWCADMVEEALQDICSGDVPAVTEKWKDPLGIVAGCLRGLLVAADGCEFISSDYSAIEAVVLAVLAGEEWRLEVFRTHGKIYEASAAMISGVPLQEILDYPKHNGGKKHPLRSSLGKVAELASGYQGGLGAWRAFGADKFMSEDDIRHGIQGWRNASPAIPKLWYGLEDAARTAIQSPGQTHSYRDVSYAVHTNVLYCRLPSGRYLSYHQPWLEAQEKWGKPVQVIQFMGWNSNSMYGPVGWHAHETYGGKLTENVVQAVSRDILADALLRLEARGYPPVMHVHDEVVCEVHVGTGSVEELESIMVDHPAWCRGWPVRASGGWRGRRYRK